MIKFLEPGEDLRDSLYDWSQILRECNYDHVGIKFKLCSSLNSYTLTAAT